MAELLAFVAVAVVVIVTPGQDTALTIRNTLAGGRRAGVRTAVGVVCGQAVWALAASAGVAALLVASEPAFVALKLAGAAYLVFLGGQALLAATRGHDESRPAAPRVVGRGHDESRPPAVVGRGHDESRSPAVAGRGHDDSRSPARAERGHDDSRPAATGRELRQGLLSNLGNPKMAVFFSSLLPQFGGDFASLLALGALFCALTLAWLCAYAAVLARAGELLRRPRVRRAIDAVTGTALVALGVRLAAADR